MPEPRCSGEKYCSGCKETKMVLAFGVDRSHSDGLCTLCRDCQRKRDAIKHPRKLVAEGLGGWP